jgi:hypothetical protein
VAAVASSQAVSARELILTAGGGSQPHADQHNTSIGLDFSFFRLERSQRQHLQLGISYTYLHTDADTHTNLWAISLYPQLSLYPKADGWFRGLFPDSVAPYFFVRALGPSYISSTRLGTREQANHFAFQAQVGLGLTFDLGRRQGIVSLSYNLFHMNDGIDVPLVLSLGMKI